MDRRELFKAFGLSGAGLVLGGSDVQAADHAGKVEGEEQPKTPLAGPHMHFCGIHIAKKDPKFQLVVQHYCAAHTTGAHGDAMFQCILFDSTAPNARLLGVEYIISDREYRKLPQAEKHFWHPHTYEVLGGGLIAPGMADKDEKKFMKDVLNTWGKTWHTWPDPKTDVPEGEPLLIWALTGDGQVDEKVLAARDKEFKVSTAEIRKRRGEEIALEVPQVSLPKSVDDLGRQWTDSGDDKPTPRR